MKNSPEIEFGIVLRAYRKQKGISQENLALKCGLDRTYISLLERGLRQPTISTLFKIADVLEIAPSQLIQEIEKRIK